MGLSALCLVLNPDAVHLYHYAERPTKGRRYRCVRKGLSATKINIIFYTRKDLREKVSFSWIHENGW